MNFNKNLWLLISRISVILLILSFYSFSVFATHNRAGEIIYKRIQGDKYEITIITFTEINNNNADRDTLEIFFGDGFSKKVARKTRQPNYNSYTNIQRNTYVTEYTYPGPGRYTLSVIDPNRNGGILNIPNSIERKFYIESYLNITLGTSNNSVVLTRDPIAFACNNVPFYYNPGAYDPDGDSLFFEMVPCKADFGLPIPDYKFPAASISFSINPVNGILTWNTPIQAGEYNVAIKVSEYRKITRPDNTVRMVNVGFVLRDMQITVYSNCSNQPPDINPVPNYCVEAGSTINFDVVASDQLDGNSQTNGNQVQLNAYGGPMIVKPIATFTTNGIDPVTGIFNWETDCNHIIKNPYLLTFEAIDNGFPELSNYQVSNILVIAPSVKNFTAETSSASISLNWEKQKCSKAVGYKIYRRSGISGFVPDSCQTGVPDNIGYSLIYEGTDNEELTYVDNNFNQGLIPGVVYCYLIVAYFSDGAESYASSEVCAQLKKDVPILTNVDILSTNQSTGNIFVAWSKPTEQDKLTFPGPYKYRIYRAEKRNFNDFILLDSTSSINDTVFTDLNLNTLEVEYTYKIEILDQSQVTDRSMGFSVLGTSIFLKTVPKDNILILNWNELVPWSNYKYRIYKKNEISDLFELIDSTNKQVYVDSNLTNKKTYCYKVESVGEYSLPSIARPLINNSQEHCNEPVDLQAPCAPELSLFVENCEVVEAILNEFDHRCKSEDPDFVTEAERVELSWTNPNLSCDTTDDVDTLILYYSPLKNGTYRPIHFQYVDKSVGVIQPTSYEFIHQMANTRAGCYYVTAIDSFGNVSPTSDTLCSDNCLIYKLPNVFTPNDDGVNDLFSPFPFCYIEEIEMKIFNRWGNLVFETKDPEVNWDGMNIFNNNPVPDGIYYYTCKVSQITVQGLIDKQLKGVVHILGSKVPSDN